MKPLEKSSETQSKKPNNKVNLLMWLFVAVSFIGFLDSTYLTIMHFTGNDLVCGPLGGCNVVTRSQYATVFGVPVALLGSFYYLTVFILSLFYIDSKKVFLLNLIPVITVFGLLASVWFVFAQLVLLKTICVYCMVSAGTSLTLFLLGAWLFFTKNNE